MCRKLRFFISVVLVLALAGMASAAGTICPDSILNGETVTVEAGQTWTADCSSCGAGLCRMYIGEETSGTGHLVVNGGTVNILGGTNFDDGRVCIEYNSDITVNEGEVYISAPGGGLFFPDSGGVGTPPAIYVYGGTVTLDEDRIDFNCERDGSMYVGCGTLRMRTAAADWCGGTHVVAAPGNEPLEYLGVDGEGYHVWTASQCAPEVEFETAGSGDFETVSTAVLTVVLSEAQEQTVTIDYAVTGGTATTAQDYNLTPGTLTFNPGDTTKTISIDIVDDGADEVDETIELTLSNPTGTDIVLGDITQHTYTIVDPRPRVAFDSADSSVAERVRIIHRPAIVSVSLSPPAAGLLTVDYAVTGGTATNGDDYNLADGTLTFPAGQTSADIGMEIVTDNTEEADETIELTLSNPAQGLLLGRTAQHTLTVIDGGPRPNTDINQDGTIDFDDVIAIIENWLDCTLNPPELCWQ